MFLIVEFNDSPRATREMEYTGELNIKRRVISIPLTFEQQAMLAPKTLGEWTANGKTTMLLEERRIICVQEEKP